MSGIKKVAFLLELADLLDKYKVAVVAKNENEYAQVFFQFTNKAPQGGPPLVNLYTGRTHSSAYEIRLLAKTHDKLSKVDKSWIPTNTYPSNDRVIEMRGPSGYTGVPYRLVVGRYDKNYMEAEWRDYANDSVTDSGPMVTHWRELKG